MWVRSYEVGEGMYVLGTQEVLEILEQMSKHDPNTLYSYIKVSKNGQNIKFKKFNSEC